MKYQIASKIKVSSGSIVRHCLSLLFVLFFSIGLSGSGTEGHFESKHSGRPTVPETNSFLERHRRTVSKAEFVVTPENVSLIAYLRQRQGSRFPPTEPLPPGMITTVFEHKRRSLLPVREATHVVRGVVEDFQPLLSSDAASIFTEYLVKLEDTIYSLEPTPLVPGDTILVERDGGSIQLSSGQIVEFQIAGEAFPVVGEEYIFFLRRNDGIDYYLVDLYWSDKETIVPLDQGRPSPEPFSEQQFFAALSQKIAALPSPW